MKRESLTVRLINYNHLEKSWFDESLGEYVDRPEPRQILKFTPYLSNGLGRLHSGMRVTEEEKNEILGRGLPIVFEQ